MASNDPAARAAQCECCHYAASHTIGGVPLCGIHKNQLLRRLGWPRNPFVETRGMTRAQVRSALGFLFPEAKKENADGE